ncbi:MerR family transcriptional regulator [Halalkalibacter kiskunsagensis]|uniref:MerR family transcriptional regulator n=1 Tax=Halalkalibacter kiskunsagensis TaxID=1548599 RepID=A0ABV6KD28_9BACI
MENEQKKYAIKEVSKSLKIPVGKLKEWEELYSNALYVQRTKTGARLYTGYDIELLKKIKILKDNNINEEHVNFILDTNNEVERDEQGESTQEYFTLLSLQNETIESIQKLTESIATIKEEFIQEVKEEIKSEMNVGHSKAKSLLQSYSHTIADTAENTHEELTRLRQDIHKEEEEKLFIQQKLEEREQQFQEFVQSYREAAAAKEKQRFPNWLNIFKAKKEGSIDLS